MKQFLRGKSAKIISFNGQFMHLMVMNVIYFIRY